MSFKRIEKEIDGKVTAIHCRAQFSFNRFILIPEEISDSKTVDTRVPINPCNSFEKFSVYSAQNFSPFGCHLPISQSLTISLLGSEMSFQENSKQMIVRKMTLKQLMMRTGRKFRITNPLKWIERSSVSLLCFAAHFGLKKVHMFGWTDERKKKLPNV